MAEVLKINLEKHPDSLSRLEVDGVLVLVQNPMEPDWRNSGVRCLDWTLNHQLRRAKNSVSDSPVFIPTMAKMIARYVILCSVMHDRDSLKNNIEKLGLKSLAMINECDEVPNEWDPWSQDAFAPVYLLKIENLTEREGKV